MRLVEDERMTTKRAGALFLAVGIALVALTVAMPIGAAVASGVDRSTPELRHSSHVLIRLSASTVIVNGTVDATVVVVPRTSGRVVYLQRLGTQRWRDIAIAVTKTRGKAVMRATLKAAGTIQLRVKVKAIPSAAAATSSTDIVVVTPVPPPYAGATLAPGDSGARVLALNKRLSVLGYWLGPPGGDFGDATQQAVYAMQKAAGLTPSGIVGPTTVAALQAGVLPKPRSTSGYVIEIDLADDLLMFVSNGTINYVLNTSTGGGYSYVDQGVSYVATTPTGIFQIYRSVDGLVTDTLGELWRPRFFVDGYAIHGDTFVPPYPVSHGCARVSDEAIDWIWANDVAPIGTEVWVYT